MNFLIDTNICSAYLKGDSKVWNKFVQYSGGVAISVITAGELWTWVSRSKKTSRSRQSIMEFLEAMEILEIDLKVGLRFGELRGTMLDQGTPIPDMDGLIAATALVYDMTLVTHNIADFRTVTDLRIEDWLG